MRICALGQQLAESRPASGCTSGPPCTARTATRLHPAAGELQHLQRLGILDQLARCSASPTLGADHRGRPRSRPCRAGGAGLEVGGAQARDGGRDVEHVAAPPCRRPGWSRPAPRRRSACRRRRRRRACSTSGWMPLPATPRRSSRSCSSRSRCGSVSMTVMSLLLRDQAFGDAFADAPGTQDQDLHAAIVRRLCRVPVRGLDTGPACRRSRWAAAPVGGPGSVLRRQAAGTATKVPAGVPLGLELAG